MYTSLPWKFNHIRNSIIDKGKNKQNKTKTKKQNQNNTTKQKQREKRKEKHNPNNPNQENSPKLKQPTRSLELMIRVLIKRGAKRNLILVTTFENIE